MTTTDAPTDLPEPGSGYTPPAGVIRMPHAAAPTNISQATNVEQQRATAEVIGALMSAHARPRSMSQAAARMEEACRVPQLAERAFYRYRRADSAVTGMSIHLARELARCFGNVDYGIKELDRDDARGMSEMMAHAWDLETNTRSTTSFLVPHLRDKKGDRGGAREAVKLTDPRDIYENNANMGARRVREMIAAILPKWYVERAQALCRATNANPEGAAPLEQRIAGVLRYFAGIGVRRDQLEEKVAVNADHWTGQEVAALGVIYQSIKAGEITIAEEFGTAPAPVGGGRIQVPPSGNGGNGGNGGQGPATPRQAPAEPTAPATPPAAAQRPTQPAAQPAGRPASRAQLARLRGLLADAGATTDNEQLAAAAALAEVPTLGDLSQMDAAAVTKAETLLKALAAEGGDAARQRIDALLPPEGDAAWDAVAAAREAHRQATDGK